MQQWMGLHINAECKRCGSKHALNKTLDVFIINSCFHCYTEFEGSIREKILMKLYKLAGEKRVSDICFITNIISIKINNLALDVKQVEIGDIFDKNDIIAISFMFCNNKMFYLIESDEILHRYYRDGFYRILHDEDLDFNLRLNSKF